MLILMEDPVMLVSVMVFAYRIAILSPLMVSGKTSGKEHLLWGIDQIASLPPPSSPFFRVVFSPLRSRGWTWIRLR